jgi:hypothetical protein
VPQGAFDCPNNITQDSLILRILTACAFTLSTMIAATAGEKGMASHYSTRDKNQTASALALHMFLPSFARARTSSCCRQAASPVDSVRTMRPPL